jgi:hypothetical protein
VGQAGVSAPYIERWPGPASVPVTVAEAAAAVPPGTAELWTIGGGIGEWPDFGPADGQLMRVYDVEQPGGEVIRVNGRAGAQWLVIRGDQGTTPTAHPAGFEIIGCLSAGGLGTLAQGVPSGNGLVIQTGTHASQEWNTLPERRLVGMEVPANEAAQGALYQAVAFGFITVVGNNLPSDIRTVEYGQRWTAATPQNVGAHTCTIDPRYPVPTSGGECRWRLDAWVAIHAATLCGSVRVMQQHTFDALYDQEFYLFGPTNTGQPVDLAADAEYFLFARLPAAATFRLLGGRAWRAG